jgi:hypothetical protein
MYYSYVEIEYVATSFSPARTDLAVKLLKTSVEFHFSWTPAKSTPNKVLAKFHLFRKFLQNYIRSRLGLDSKFAKNAAMCLVHK